MSSNKQTDHLRDKQSGKSPADLLAEKVRSQIDTGEIRKRKEHVRDTIFARIEHRKKQKIHRITFISIAASLLVLLTLGYNVFADRAEDASMAWIEKSTPKGVRDSVLLADGSKIYLNGGSVLKYPQRFTGKTRKVLFNGEGYFEIAKNPDNPFLVNTEQIEVKVLGTKFNLKAYANDPTIETILEEGHVQVIHSESKQVREIKPDDCITFNKQMNTFSIRKVDPLRASMWRNGKYSFRSTPLVEFAQSLERGFGVTFVIEDPDIASKRFTGDFIQGESIDEILNILEISSNIKFRKNDTIITISKKQ